MDYRAAIAIGSKFDSKGLDQAKKGLKETQSAADAIGEKFTEMGKKILAAIAVEKIVEFGKNILETGEQFDLLRQKTGIAVETLDALRNAAELSNVGFEDVQTSMRKFSVAISDATHGSKEASQAFAALGVSARNQKGSGEVLLQVADGFARLKDGADKAKIATILFGRAGTDLIPVLNEGREGILKFNGGFTSEFSGRAQQFNDTIVAIGQSARKLGVEALSQMLPALQETVNAFRELGSGDNSDLFQNIGEGFRVAAIAGLGFVTALEDGFDAVYTILKQLGTTIGAVASSFAQGFSAIGDSAAALAKGNFRQIGQIEKQYASAQLDQYRDLVSQRDKADTEYAARVMARGKTLSDFTSKLSKNSLLLGDGTRDEILKRQRGATAPELKASALGESSGLQNTEAEQIRKFIVSQNEANSIRKDEILKAEMASAAYKELTETKKIQAESDKLSVTLTDEGKRKLREATEAIVEHRKALIQLEADRKHSFGVGAREAFNDYLEAAKDVAAQTRNLFNHAFQGMEDAIVKFVQTGKISFSDLATSIEADLIRIAVRQAAVSAVSGIGAALASGIGAAAGGASGANPNASASSGFHFAAGGVMTEYGPAELRRYAGGGIANSPQVALYGEGSRPEAFVPLPDGRSIPVTMKGNGATSVSIVVNMNSDGSSDSKTTGDQQGKILGKALEASVLSVIMKQKRPGGMLA